MDNDTLRELAIGLASLNFGAFGPVLLTKEASDPAPTKASGAAIEVGDWMRVKRGPLRDAEGSVVRTKVVSPLVTVVEIRQLNGNLIRLPRSHFEFSVFRPEVCE